MHIIEKKEMYRRYAKRDVFISYFIYLFCHLFTYKLPPLWFSGQSSWLQIRRPGFDSRHYQKQKVVCLERGPLSLVSTTEELLDRKSSSFCLEI
jgi:hypothetical protein